MLRAHFVLARYGQHMPRPPQDVGLCGELRLSSQTKKSSQQGGRRLPAPALGIDVNFCRNPHCAMFAVSPAPSTRKGRHPAGVNQIHPHGKITGSDDEKTYECPSCRRTSIIKSDTGFTGRRGEARSAGSVSHAAAFSHLAIGSGGRSAAVQTVMFSG